MDRDGNWEAGGIDEDHILSRILPENKAREIKI